MGLKPTWEEVPAQLQHKLLPVRLQAHDLGGRNGRRVETVPENIIDEVLARIATLLQ